MIKRLASLIAVLVLCVLMLPINSFKANAEMLTGYPRESSLIDELGIIGEGTPEFNELDTLIKATAAKTNLNLTVFIAGKYRPEEDAVVFTEDSYDEIFGEDTDGIFYYMDLSGYHPASDCLSSAGRAMLTYPEHDDTIFNTLDQYLPFSGQEPERNKICEAIRVYLSLIEKYSSDKPSKGAYYYHQRTGKYYYYSKGEFTISTSKPIFVYYKPFCISAVIGFFIALLVYLITKSNYKFKGSPDPRAYVANDLSGFRVKQDIFIKTDTHRTRISSNSGGGGGRSGGGSHHSHSGGHHTSVHHR